MISFRRCLVIAAFLVTCLFLLRSSHHSNQLESSKVSNKQKLSTPTTHAPPSAVHQEPKLSIDELSRKPLRERLRYQFPYHLESKFPAYIWQTWKYTPESGRFDKDLRPMEASWTTNNPGFVHQVFADKTTLYVIKYLYAAFPEVLEAYQAMPLPVLKADFFRYLILLARGGIYTDIDTYSLKPAADWLPIGFDRSTIGLVIGIEADPDRPDWAEWYSRRIQFCQWTIQSKPGHPALRDIVATITEDVLRMKRLNILTEKKMDKSIVEFTGPAVWTDSIFRYLNNELYFDIGKGGKAKNVSATDFTGIKAHKKVGDVVVLPITSFSPGVQQMGAEEPDDEMAFVKHEFSGSWKSDEDRQIGIISQ